MHLTAIPEWHIEMTRNKVIYMSNPTGNAQTFSLLISACFCFLNIISRANCQIWWRQIQRIIHRILFIQKADILIPYYVFLVFLCASNCKQMKEKRNDFVVKYKAVRAGIYRVWVEVDRILQKCREVDKCIRSRMQLLYRICICTIAFLFLSLLLVISSNF